MATAKSKCRLPGSCCRFPPPYALAHRPATATADRLADSHLWLQWHGAVFALGHWLDQAKRT